MVCKGAIPPVSLCFYSACLQATMYMDSYTGLPLTTWSLTVVAFLYLVTCMMTSTAYEDYSAYSAYEDEGNTYFIPQPNNVSYNRGETAVLQCSIENLGDKYVVWRKASEPHPISVGELIYSPDKRFNVSFSFRRREFDLLIHDAQPTDSGVYECQVSSVNKIIRLVMLKVKDSGKGAFSRNPNDKQPESPHYSMPEIVITGKEYVNSGETIRLVCNITGVTYAPQDLDWFKNGILLRSSAAGRLTILKDGSISHRKLNSVLEIRKSRHEDSGNYVCRNSELLIKSKKVIVLSEERSNPDKRGTAGEAHNCQMCNKQWWTLFLSTLFISIIAKGSLYLT